MSVLIRERLRMFLMVVGFAFEFHTFNPNRHNPGHLLCIFALFFVAALRVSL
jgi:hypothetical protein